MATVNEYTDEQLNYFRICYLTTEILQEGLREIFKQEWDKLYKSTKGEWRDEPQNGMDFYKGESPGSQERYAHILATMKNGNREEWNCNMLFYAILSSDCVGSGLSPKRRKNVHDLRDFRNEKMARIPQKSLAETDFQNAICKVYGAFQALGLPIAKIEDLKCRKTFLMKDFERALKEVDDVRKEAQTKEDQKYQLQKEEAPSFCILPPKPSHDIGSRDREVAKIAQQLRELKESSDDELSYLYVTGNPGSGKSQLAGLVAKRFFDEATKMPGGSSFVMTLNAASPDSLLESYASFARQLKCQDYSVMETLNSEEWNVEEKITRLKMLIAVKISCYTSWLLVIDNVISMSSVHAHLPQIRNEAWSRGQVLITTQDTTSIPSKSSFVSNISVSKGMVPNDAISLLSKLSGVPNSELVPNVAKTLEYQPLALAGAAFFVKQIRQHEGSTHFGWDEYLKILEKSKLEIREDTLCNTNPTYPNTMTRAITLAVEKMMTSDKILQYLFTVISLCSPNRLKWDMAITFMMTVNENLDEEDKEQIRMRLKRCSLLLFEDDHVGYFIRVHQVVLNAIKHMAKNYPEIHIPQVVNRGITSFNEVTVTTPTVNRSPSKFQEVRPNDIDVATTCNYLPSTYQSLGDLEQANDCNALAIGLDTQICRDLADFEQAKWYQQRDLAIAWYQLQLEHDDVAKSYNNLASLYEELGYLELAKKYQQRALAIRLEILGPEHVDVANIYCKLASIHQDLGDLEQTKEYLQCVLAIRLEKLGPGNLEVATSYCKLASSYKKLGDVEQAIKYQHRAVAIRLDTLGPENVDNARSYYTLASIHKVLGDLAQAKEYQQLALAIRLNKRGPEHVDVATSYYKLASIYKDLGDLSQAKEYQQPALAIRLDKLGPEHFDVATSYCKLASIHCDLGDHEQAKEYPQRTVAFRLDKLGHTKTQNKVRAVDES